MLTPDFISQLMGVSISDFQFLKGGRNNEVASFLIEDKKLVCKKFSQEDKVERFKREISFLDYCSTIQISSTPELYAYYFEHNTVILSFIDGKQLEQVSWSFIYAICDLLEKLNDNEFCNAARKLPFAADALSSTDALYVSLQKRIRGFDQSKSVKVKELCEKLNEVFLSMSHKDNLNFPLLDSSNRIPPGPNLIVSPSDVGIHNYFETLAGPMFIDFEYSGLDSPLKLFLDLWTHPDLNLSEEHMHFIYSKLRRIFAFRRDIIDKNLLSIFVVKWCLIMLKTIDSDNDFSKIIDYAQRFGIDIG